MRIRTKHITAILLTLCLFLSLVGCSNAQYQHNITAATDGSNVPQTSTNINNTNTWRNLPNASTFVGVYKNTLKEILGYDVSFGDISPYGLDYKQCSFMNDVVSIIYRTSNEKVTVACTSIQAAKYMSLSDSERTDAMTALFAIVPLFTNVKKTASSLTTFIDGLEEVETGSNSTHLEKTDEGIQYSYKYQNSVFTFQVKYIGDGLDNRETTGSTENTLTQENTSSINGPKINGKIEKNDGDFPSWRIILDNPIIVEDWDGKHSCAILYFYDDTTLNGLPISEYVGESVTLTGTPENYRGGGQWFIYDPVLVN